MPLPDWPVEGGCRCGALRFRLTAAPFLAAACHCRGCQRMTGSSHSLTLSVEDDGFAVIRGEEVVGGADPAFGHRFCPRCLSWVWTKNPRMDGFRNVRATMLDEPGWARPFVETWTAQRLPWGDTGAERSYAGFPPAAEYDALVAAYPGWAAGATR
jgi:hypothetical protein